MTIETVTMTGPEYVDRDALIYQLMKQATIDSQPRAIKRAIRIVRNFPKSDVVEREAHNGE